jgi:hypothetical protein
MIKSLFSKFLILLILISLIGPKVLESKISKTNTGNYIDYSRIDIYLQNNFNANGAANWSQIRTDSATVNALCNWLNSVCPRDYTPQNEKIVFWINAYNMFSIRNIIKHYPIKSIEEINDAFSIKNISLEGKQYSLNYIKTILLQNQLKENRAIFCITDFAISSPVLLNKAFNAQYLEPLMQNRVRTFMNDTMRNTIASDTCFISQIFNKTIFNTSDKSIKDFINKYSVQKVGDSTVIFYKKYNFRLNEK